MSFAVGQALEGFMPFYVNFAMFVTGTAWTQLRQACYAKANIKLVGSHPVWTMARMALHTMRWRI